MSPATSEAKQSRIETIQNAAHDDVANPTSAPTTKQPEMAAPLSL